MSDIEDVPAPRPRGRPRKVVAEVVQEAPPPSPEPPKRGQPRKAVAEVEDAPPEPAPKARGRPKKQRDPSEMEPARVSFSSARGERSFAAQRPRRTPQSVEPVEPVVPQPGPFQTMHHRSVSARQAALENLMMGWR